MSGKKILIPIFVVILLFIGGSLIIKSQKNSPTPTSQTRPSTQPLEVVLYNCEEGKNAFDILTEYAEVKFDQDALGKHVTAIDTSSQRDGKFWSYSIEGKEATVSADAYICQKNEEIKWELR